MMGSDVTDSRSNIKALENQKVTVVGTYIIILKCGVARLVRVSPSELISQSSESHTAAHKFIEGDPAVCAVALHDAVHGLRAQIVAQGDDGLLQLMALHGPAVVPVEGCKGVLPAVQSLPQLLELIKAHSAGHVPIQHVDHQSAGLQAEGLVRARDAGTSEAALQLVW